MPTLASADGKFTIRVGNGAVTKMVPTFAAGAAGEAVGIIGSSGYVEISVNKANAAKTLAAGRGAEVTVELGQEWRRIMRRKTNTPSNFKLRSSSA